MAIKNLGSLVSDLQTQINHLEFKDINNALIEVFESSGRTVLKIENQYRINLEKLANGIYFIKFTSISGKTNYGKIMLNK